MIQLDSGDDIFLISEGTNIVLTRMKELEHHGGLNVESQ